jgi:hypothetical protein
VRRRNLGALAAGLLFIALAAFALLRVTVLKDRLPTEATPNQVYGVAFTLAMVGVAVVQGTALARRTVVVLATLGLVGVLVGVSMVIEQQELPQAVWLIAAAIVMVPYAALLALLVGEAPSPWRVAIGTSSSPATGSVRTPWKWEPSGSSTGAHVRRSRSGWARRPRSPTLRSASPSTRPTAGTCSTGAATPSPARGDGWVSRMRSR